MRRKCDISSGPRSGGLATMIADPNESESKAKTIAGQLPNRLPMRDSALRATSGLCTEARCCISSPNHEIAIIEIGLPSDPRPMICRPIGIRVRSRRGHLDNRPTRRIAGNWWYGYTSPKQCTAPRQCTREDGSWIISGSMQPMKWPSVRERKDSPGRGRVPGASRRHPFSPGGSRGWARWTS